VPAIGLCKNCHKGLCEECAVDVGNGLACKHQCERQVRSINERFNHNQRMLRRWAPAYRRNAIAFSLLGLAFLGYGIFLAAAGQFILGVPAGAFGIFLLYAALMSHNEGRRQKLREPKA
jgi:hypothetical protein